MGIEDKLDARNIVRKAGMSDRPEYYSGRGAMTCDLNDTILESAYKLINQEHGEAAAKSFAQMVVDIPKLTATDFLLTLYYLEGNNWEWNKRLLNDTQGIYATDEGSGMGTILSVLGGLGERDETYFIRGEFLRRHGIQATTSKFDSFFDEEGYFIK